MNIPKRSSFYEELRYDRLVRLTVKISIGAIFFLVILPWTIAIIEGNHLLALEEVAQKQQEQLLNIALHTYGGHD